MGKHVAVLGFIYGILGVLEALFGLGVIIFGLGTGIITAIGGGEGSGGLGAIVALVGGWVGLVLLIVGAIDVLVAVGLLARRRWGRILGIIASALKLFPIGWLSILGLYGLWVLVPERGAREFQSQR